MGYTIQHSGQTINATPKEIFLLSGLRFFIDTDATYQVQGSALAVDSISQASKRWTFDCLIKNVSGTVSLVGSATVTAGQKDSAASTWALALTADDTNKSLDYTFTGAAGRTIDIEITSSVDEIGATAAPSITGYYCSDTDIVNMIGLAQLTQLSNDTVNSTIPNNTVVEAIIQRAQDYIDNQLSGTYTVPFTTVPVIIRDACVSIAIMNLFLRRFSIMEVPKNWVSAYDGAYKLIDNLASLTQRLDQTLYPVLAISGKIDQPSAGTRVADFSSSSPYSMY